LITAIIPARGGSKSIPRKNIVDLGGFPLIAYSIAACKLSKNIDRIVVSTEDKEIAMIAKSFGAEIPFVRPPELSQDNSTDVGFLRHFFDNIDVEEVALIRPTTPFRDPKIVDEAIEQYFKIRDKITGFRTVSEINENPYKVYKIEDNICRGFFPNFNGEENYTNLPRQTFPKAYMGNGHIDIVKKETALQNTTFGSIIYSYTCQKEIDIDSPFDLKLARIEIQSGNKLLDFLKEQKNE
jgi:CMP-N-acetylneuraminic acid synthetase|tara:strand:+ start:336 stop:1052 length:717 start_codon:yes stop_codon:yes gene_type:complete